jgi:mannose-6-phosphate isomerase-like protein (cupin superfamily)
LGSFLQIGKRDQLKVKQITLAVLTAALLTAGQAGVDIHSVKDLAAKKEALAKKRTQFASETLERYGNHYTMLAYREVTGSSELHEHEADIFFITSGGATILTGGKLVNPHTEKPGELRGTSIEGGERHALGTGDVIHIPAGTPHQMLVDKGTPVTYFVIKVTGQ